MSVQSINSTAPSLAPPVANPRQSAIEAQLAQATVVTQQAPPSVKDAQASRQQLDQAVKSVHDFVSTFNNSLQFSDDGDTGKTVVKVIDTATEEVIKQIP